MENHSCTYSFLVGTYTDKISQGINLLKFDAAANLLEVELVAAGVKTSSFIISNKAGNLVFSLEETSGEKGDNIVSFSKVGDQLVPLDTIPSFGDHPYYLALSLNKNFVAVSNYSGGSFRFYILNQENKLEHVQTIQHEGLA
jgi:6-phosphogluconolactonase